MRRLVYLLALIALTGCAQQRTTWVRLDGQRGSTDPVLAQQFETDRTICLGERQRADLSGVTVTGGGLAGIAAASQRADSADAVARGCMAQRGYMLVPEDQAEAKSAEFAAIAAEKARREREGSAPAPTRATKQVQR